MAKVENPLNLTIKGLKTWVTHDGGGYQFSLYQGPLRVAFVHQGGDGGPTEVQWFSKDSAVEKQLRAYVETLPPDDSYGVTVAIDIDMYLEELLSEYEVARKMEKALARVRKTGTPYRLKTDEPNAYRSINTKDTEKAKAFLVKKYGPDNFVVL